MRGLYERGKALAFVGRWQLQQFSGEGMTVPGLPARRPFGKCWSFRQIREHGNAGDLILPVCDGALAFAGFAAQFLVNEAAFDGRGKPALGLHLAEQRPGRRRQVVRQRLDIGRAGSRIGDGGKIAFLLQNQAGVARHAPGKCGCASAGAIERQQLDAGCAANRRAKGRSRPAQQVHMAVVGGQNAMRHLREQQEIGIGRLARNLKRARPEEPHGAEFRNRQENVRGG